MTPQQHFRKAFDNQPNFMTPDPVEYGIITGSTMYELSQGEGMQLNGLLRMKPGTSGNLIYGVTVITYDAETKTYTSRHELSKKCNDLAEAREYITQLKKDIRK